MRRSGCIRHFLYLDNVDFNLVDNNYHDHMCVLFDLYSLKFDCTHVLTATICTSTGRGNLGLLTGYASSLWTDYSYTFTASKTEQFLIFGFEAAINRSWLMDNTSLIEEVSPFSEILQNPDFELSNTSILGWQQWCASYCHWGTSGRVISEPDCYLGSGNCFQSSCLGPGTDFIGQSFVANPGSNYTVSFALALTGSGGNYRTMFYADIYWFGL